MIESAVQSVFADPANRTQDLGGQLRTAELTQLVIANLR
jgi:isocitrate/isopropylmalate dehydrogenase